MNRQYYLRMKTFSFISGIVLSLSMVTPSSAYFRTYNGPPAAKGTVQMSYIQGRGLRILSQTPSTMKAATLPKFIVQTGKGVSKNWPLWIAPPSWMNSAK
jgi:hypothetical protein